MEDSTDGEEEEEDVDEYEAQNGELEGGSEDKEEVEVEAEGSGGVIVEEEDIDEDPEPEVSSETKVEEFLARQAELALRQEDIAKAKAEGDWHPDELFVYERLLMRSFEELIPKEWKIDFPTLPELLFTDDLDKAFIKDHRPSSYRGARALKGLLSLGIRVKDKLDYGLPAERLIEKEILDYVKWSEQDGGYHRHRFIPVLSVVRARARQDISLISKTITDQMSFLAQRHRESLGYFADEEGNIQIDANRRTPPLLYGIIVAQKRAIFMTLDSTNPHAVIRHLRHFDFSDKPEGVWNGFAIAILVVAARNYMISIKDELEIDDTPLTDEDA
ncbi:hypothetical protein BJ875DRAFT_504593 [Amylocarpus encephaloides]|uniref:Uncharacterized protein n=1 Tax=Amylocarpus encephaloides TaxID=45428 RepID=A0A9P7YKE9_9HELO|nr:hypothetical protein BJ875DRAFT_504593 [Amylocarpus encephaloides]